MGEEGLAGLCMGRWPSPGSGLCRVSRLRGLTGGLRLRRDQKPTLAGPGELQRSLGARSKDG